MYKVDAEGKQIFKLSPKTFTELRLLERFDIQEWIAKSPEILGEDLLIVSKELELPSRIRIDLLAVDKKGNLIVIELKRDESGSSVEWQAIKYASRILSITSVYCPCALTRNRRSFPRSEHQSCPPCRAIATSMESMPAGSE